MGTQTIVPRFVRAARILFFANAAIWLGFAVATLATKASASPGGGSGASLVAVLMLVNAAAMLVGGIGIGRQNRLFFYFAVLVLVLNLVLSLSDWFGIYDFIPLLVSGFLLGLLMATRSFYLSTG
jgi:hypothetical protein